MEPRVRRVFNDWIAIRRKLDNILRDQYNHTRTILGANELIVASRMSPAMRQRLEWTFRAPKRVREWAVMEFKASVASSERQHEEFVFHPTSKKAHQQTITISSEQIRVQNPTTITVSGMTVHLTEPLRETVSHNVKLIRRGTEYYMIFVAMIPLPPERPTPDKLVALDPGLISFGTFWSPHGEQGEYGTEFYPAYDDLYRRKLSIRGDPRLGLRRKQKALNKLERRWESRMCDFQWKLAHWLLREYRFIITSRLWVPKGDKVKQRYYHHCRFVDRLIHKSVEYAGSEIHVIKEWGTSKTCGLCYLQDSYYTGENDRIFNCNSCGARTHRDINGARNNGQLCITLK